jgi:hypothetical protein
MGAQDLTSDVVESAVGGRLDELDAMLDAALATPSWRELRLAEELGVVEIRSMGTMAGVGFSREAAIAEYLRLIADLTEPSSSAAPMLDYSAAGVLEVGTTVGALKHELPAASVEAALAAHYMGYLPTVSAAALTAVLKVRHELRGPLVRFRAVMAELAREVESSPARPGFDREADDLFRREVAPQLATIDELTLERGLRNVIRREVAGSQGGAVTKAVIGLAAGSVAGLPAMAQAAVAAVVVAGDIASGVNQRRGEIDSERTSNRLFWMYDVERRLTSASEDQAG